MYDAATMALPVEEVEIRDFNDFLRLPEYSTTLPTGQTPGKRWRRSVGRRACPSGWVTGEYGDVVDEHITIRWRRVVYVAEGCPLPAGFGMTRHPQHDLIEVWSDAVPGGVLGPYRGGAGAWAVISALLMVR